MRQSIWHKARSCLESFIGILVLCTILIVTLGVVSRLLKIPIVWTDEMLRIIFVWLTFIMAAVGYNNDELIGLDLLKESVKDQPKKKKMLDIVHAVLGLVFSVFMSVQTYLIVTTQIRTQEITPVLSFPVWMQSLGYFIGCVMFFGFSIRKLIKCFSRTKP